MATYVLIPGAGGEAWYWHLVVPLLEAAGHRAVAVEPPAGDPEAGLDTYVAAALDAVGPPQDEVVVVGQSLGGFTAPLVAEPLGAVELIFVAAMIPRPGEKAEDWWSTSGFREVWGDQEMDDMQHFFHDLPPALLQEVLDFMDRLIRERLGVEPEHVEAGHLPALANPAGLVEVLLA